MTVMVELGILGCALPALIAVGTGMHKLRTDVDMHSHQIAELDKDSDKQSGDDDDLRSSLARLEAGHARLEERVENIQYSSRRVEGLLEEIRKKSDV